MRALRLHDGGPGAAGARVFVKRMRPHPDVCRHANTEGELLAPLLLAVAGLAALHVRPVFDREIGEWSVLMPFVREDARPFELVADTREAIPVDLLARLAVVDLLIGNADRQPRNLLRTRDGRIVPIDHDLTFIAPSPTTRAIGLVGFVPGFDGVPSGPRDNGYRRWLLSRCGSIDHLLRSTPLYRPFWAGAREPSHARALLDAAAVVIDRMDDEWIDGALSSLPDEVIAAGADARKREIRDTLGARRDGLLVALARYRRGRVGEADRRLR